MKKADDEVATSPSGDENCVSGLIGSVLTLIISILVWLQKVGCKNGSALTDCPETCELLPTLEKLSLFARQSEGNNADGSDGKSCDCQKHGKKEKREKSDKNLKKAKSGENHSVLYAVSQDETHNPDCKKCCKKVMEPKEKKENDNVIFEVVAAQMVENQTQTDTKELVETGTQPEEVKIVEKEVETVTTCICSTTQVSTPDITKVETQDVGVQVEIEIKRSIKNIKDPPSDPDIYACQDQGFEGCMEDDDDDEEEDFEEDEEEEDYNDREPEGYLPCPTRCVSYGQARPPVYRRPPSYPPMRQEGPSFYRNYESAPVYNQYNSGYDPYGPAVRYAYPPQQQQYYQKVTRTIQRGPRKAEYPNQLQRQISPTQRPKVASDNQSDAKGVEKFSQSMSPSTPPSSPTASVQINKKESANRREQNVAKDKDCVPHCPGNKPATVRKLSATPVPPPQSAPPPPAAKPHSPVVKKDCDPKCPKYAKPVATEKGEVAKTPSKKCVARCANGGNQNKNQSKPNTPDSKQKPRPVSFMPKGAIPVEPRDVLEVEEPPASKQTILADSVMSVEASKRSK